MKSKNLKVEPGFEDLFSFSDKEEKTAHRAQMISYRILSEIEKICDERNIKMKDLAAMIGTSASYITQLFRGNKQVNTAFMAKCEEAFNMSFNFSIHYDCKENSGRTKIDPLPDLQIVNSRHAGSRLYYTMKGNGKAPGQETRMKPELKKHRNKKKKIK
jgi:transcriptional regulator with XRE-family HTH domain